MSLYRESTGAGPDVALLHGFGLHGGIFEGLAATLAASFRVHALDLPGHGRSPWAKGAADLEGLSGLVAGHLPETCAIVGWSLGGLVAVRLATRFPARVPRLVLIATPPVGMKRRDFMHAMDEPLIAGLAARLGKDWRGVVQEFVGLEARGDERQLETLRELRQRLFAHGAPSTAALAAGLELLRTVDLRAELPRVRAPTLVMAGEHDRLTPPAASRALAGLIPGARLETVARTAHAPFLSRPAEVAASIAAFLGAP